MSVKQLLNALCLFSFFFTSLMALFYISFIWTNIEGEIFCLKRKKCVHGVNKTTVITGFDSLFSQGVSENKFFFSYVKFSSLNSADILYKEALTLSSMDTDLESTVLFYQFIRFYKNPNHWSGIQRHFSNIQHWLTKNG